MKDKLLLPSLLTMGEVGQIAVERIGRLKTEASQLQIAYAHLQTERETAERTIREQHLQIKRLKRRITELESML